MSERRILVALSDTHCGNQLGLLSPETVLAREDAEGNVEYWRPNLTRTQRYLWDLYLSHIDNIIELAAGDDIILLHCGDLTQGYKYPSLWVSGRMADQVIMAEDVMVPWFESSNPPSVTRLARGTASHNFEQGSSSELVSHLLQHRYPDRDISALYHGLLDVGGVTVDYAHHGPGPGIRDWTKGNQVRYYLKNLIATEWKQGRMPARLVLRGHYHTFMPETVYDRLDGQQCRFDMYLLPAYCAMGDHGHRATRGAWLQDHGLVAFEIAYGHIVETHDFVSHLDLRTEEAV